ncbi:MAG: PD-(D/E)XK nuclease family protein [Nitrospinota bacterium]
MAAAPPKELYLAPFHRLEALLGDLLRRMAAGDPFRARRVVVISNLVRDRLQERLAPGGAFAGVDFLTPLDLAQEVAGPRLRREGRRPLPPGGAAALAWRLLAENRARLRRLKPPPEAPGYEEALAASLADLREAGLAGADLRRLRGLDREAAEHLRDLALLLDRWESRLASLGFCDEAGLLRLACEEAGGAPPDVPTVLYGFADMNALQRRLLAACCERASAAALVPAEEDAPACAFAGPMIAWLRAEGFADQPAGEGAARPFAGVGRRLFGEAGAAALPEGALRVVSAPAQSREAFELVRELLHGPEPDGRREAAVLLPGGDGYPALFEEIGRALGVEVRAGQRPPLARTPAGRALLRMLSLGERGYPRAELLRFLDEGRFTGSASFLGWLKAEGGGEDPLLPARWEDLSRRLPYAEGEEGWRAAIERARKEGSAGAGRASPLRSFEGALNLLFAQLRALPERGLPSQHGGAAARALEALAGEVEEKPDVLAALREMGRFDPLLGEVDAGEFRRWAARLLERPRPGGPPRPARVRLLSLQAARGLSFEAVAVAGMAEGVFPAHGREDPLLPDDLRARLNGAFGGRAAGLPPLLPLKGDRMREERYLFWLALQSAERRLILGVPRAGGGAGEGSGRPPSLFLHHLAAAAGAAGEDESGLPPFGAAVLRAAAPGLEGEFLRRAPVSLLEADLGEMARLLQHGKPETGALARIGAAPGFARKRSALDDRWRRGVLTAQDGMLGAPDVREALRARLRPGERPVPVTGLESFFGCPYRFALERLLGLASPLAPSPPLEADAGLRGRLFHEALRSFFGALAERGAAVADLGADGLPKALSRAVEEAFRRVEGEGGALLPFAWRLLRASVERQLEGFLRKTYGDDGRAWRVVQTEESFGRRDVPPLAVSLEDGRRLLVSGRYDLLERSAEGEYRFVDFKSGGSGRAVPKKNDPLGGGQWLQPHLYARHGREVLGREARIGAAYAFVTERRSYRLFPIPPEKIEALGPRVDRLLGHFLRAAEAGVFFPLPSSACNHCDFVSICGPERGPRAARKAEAAERVAMREAQAPPPEGAP